MMGRSLFALHRGARVKISVLVQHVNLEKAMISCTDEIFGKIPTLIIVFKTIRQDVFLMSFSWTVFLTTCFRNFVLLLFEI